jgi:flavin reductase (DIM6/NTAB) family NADH-FMN oxidoreductase RutF
VNEARVLPSQVSAEEFRKVLGRFCSGVTVISVDTGAEVHAMTATAFSSLALEPPSVLMSIDNKARMNGHLLAAERFGVSILAEGQADLSSLFAGSRTADVAPGFERLDDVPVLSGAIAKLACVRAGAYVEGDHTIFTGRIAACTVVEGDPLLYFSGRYGRLDRSAV